MFTFFLLAVAVWSLSRVQPFLSPVGCRLPGSSVQGISKARILPSPGDLPHPGIKPASLALAGGFFTTEPLGKPLCGLYLLINNQSATKDILTIDNKNEANLALNLESTLYNDLREQNHNFLLCEMEPIYILQEKYSVRHRHNFTFPVVTSRKK